MLLRTPKLSILEALITSVLSERRNQFADERRSEVKYQTLSIASIATNQSQGLLRFGSTHCYRAPYGVRKRFNVN